MYHHSCHFLISGCKYYNFLFCFLQVNVIINHIFHGISNYVIFIIVTICSIQSLDNSLVIIIMLHMKLTLNYCIFYLSGIFPLYIKCQTTVLPLKQVQPLLLQLIHSQLQLMIALAQYLYTCMTTNHFAVLTADVLQYKNKSCIRTIASTSFGSHLILWRKHGYNEVNKIIVL